MLCIALPQDNGWTTTTYGNVCSKKNGKPKKEKKKSRHVPPFAERGGLVDRALGEGAVPIKLRRDGVKVSRSGGRTLGESSSRAHVLALGEELYAENLFSEQPSPMATLGEHFADDFSAFTERFRPSAN